MQTKAEIAEKKREYYQQNKEKFKEYRQQNKDKRAEYRRRWREANPEYYREYRQANKVKIAEQKRDYYQNNKGTYTERQRNYHQNNIQARLTKNLRTRIWHALKGNAKSVSTLELLGCTTEELKQHIENLFQEGMSWDNYASDGWHLDHIKPCISFDLTDPEQQKICFHYTNLQPLWAEDNLSKGSNLNHEEEAVG